MRILRRDRAVERVVLGAAIGHGEDLQDLRGKREGYGGPGRPHARARALVDDSPYQSLSSFAGNGLLISSAWLIEDELVKPSDCPGGPFSAAAVDFDAVTRFKYQLLETAWRNFRSRARPDQRPAFEKSGREQAYWLDDIALLRALKTR